MVGYMTGGTACFSVWLGDELGLYAALAGKGPRSAGELAADTGCNERLIREWLDTQAAAQLIEYDAAGDRYTLSAEGAMTLADDRSPVFTARGMNAFGASYLDIEKIKAAFRSDGALALGRSSPVPVQGHGVDVPHGLPLASAGRMDSVARGRGGQTSRWRPGG